MPSLEQSEAIATVVVLHGQPSRDQGKDQMNRGVSVVR